MSADELTWEPPGPGQWYPSPEHMPTPVTRLFAELFPLVAVGLGAGVPTRYGLPPNHGAFGAVNAGSSTRPARPGVVDVEALDAHGRGDAGDRALDRRPRRLARRGPAGHGRREPGAARRGSRRR